MKWFFLWLLLLLLFFRYHFFIPQSNNNGNGLIHFDDGTCNETVTDVLSIISFVLFERNNFLADWFPKMLTLNRNDSSSWNRKICPLISFNENILFEIFFTELFSGMIFFCACEIHLEEDDLSMNKYFHFLNPSKVNYLHINCFDASAHNDFI